MAGELGTGKRPARTIPRPWLAGYPPSVAAQLPIATSTLSGLLDEAIGSFPDATALNFFGAATSYRRLGQDVARVAGGLAEAGVRPGERVLLALPNCPQQVTSLFALLRLGAVAVLANPLAGPAELRSHLQDSEAAMVLCVDKVYPRLVRAMAGTAVRKVVLTSLEAALPRTPGRLRRQSRRDDRARQLAGDPPGAATTMPFQALSTAAPMPFQASEPESPAVWLYTSGTSGEPKAAALSQANLGAAALTCRAWLTGPAPGRETTLALLPFCHAFGLTLGLGLTVSLAGQLLLLPSVELDQIVRAITRQRPTILPGIPALLALLAAAADRGTDLSCLHWCLSAGSPLPPDVRERLTLATGRTVTECYGLTEAAGITHATPAGVPSPPGTLGFPLPDVEAKVVALSGARRVVASGRCGELAVRGPQIGAVHPGSSGSVDLTDDGFLLTGDLVRMDQHGMFSFVERRTDRTRVAGRVVHLTDIEQVIDSMEQVAESAVVAGQGGTARLRAFVIRREGFELDGGAVRAYCAQRLPGHQVPVEVHFREWFPRSASGRPLRRLLALAPSDDGA